MQIFSGDTFSRIEYLAAGTEVQRLAYSVLSGSGIFEMLQPYQPLLVGTIPLDIAVDGSDLDIICEAQDLDEFQAVVNKLFAKQTGFRAYSTVINNQRTVVANFQLLAFEVEIFGQVTPVKKQNGYRHMMKEYEILTNRGQEFKQKIIALKMQGVKTEPAFAKLLNIQGDPYEGLLSYKDI